MKHDCATLHADYIECEPKTFKGFFVYFNGKKIKNFKGGTAVEAWKKVRKYIDEDEHPRIIFSSDIDNYLMDSDDEELGELIYGKCEEDHDPDSNLMNLTIKAKKK